MPCASDQQAIGGRLPRLARSPVVTKPVTPEQPGGPVRRARCGEGEQGLQALTGHSPHTLPSSSRNLSFWGSMEASSSLATVTEFHPQCPPFPAQRWGSEVKAPTNPLFTRTASQATGPHPGGGSKSHLINITKDVFLSVLTGNSKGFGSSVPESGPRPNTDFLFFSVTVSEVLPPQAFALAGLCGTLFPGCPFDCACERGVFLPTSPPPRQAFAQTFPPQ